MKATQTSLPGVVIFEPEVHSDFRGFLLESYRKDIMNAHGISTDFVQENFSKSSRHVLRGLHYQLKYPQAKLCWVPLGAVLDVAVDIRLGSPTFGKHIAVHLSSKNHKLLYVPRGFAHGMLVLEENTRFQYKCEEYYMPEYSKGIAWNDPTLAINWGVEQPVLSETDQNLPFLEDIQKENLPVF